MQSLLKKRTGKLYLVCRQAHMTSGNSGIQGKGPREPASSQPQSTKGRVGGQNVFYFQHFTLPPSPLLTPPPPPPPSNICNISLCPPPPCSLYHPHLPPPLPLLTMKSVSVTNLLGKNIHVAQWLEHPSCLTKSREFDFRWRLINTINPRSNERNLQKLSKVLQS